MMMSKWLCFEEAFIYAFITFFFFFFSRDQLTKQKKMSQITHLAAVFDCRTIIVGYYNNIIIQLACTCAYNIDDLSIPGGSIRPVWKRLSILYERTPDIYVAIRFT